MDENNYNVNTPDSSESNSKSVTLTGIKNVFWSLSIIISLAAVAVGLVFAVFHKNNGVKEDFSPSFVSDSETDSSAPEIVLGEGNGNARGVLNLLTETPDAGEEYTDKLIFLVDSTYVGLRDMQIVGSNQVWATQSGSMSMEKVNMATIKFPNDGSEITASSAAMVTKPEILVIGIGMDGLNKVDEQTFLINYETLIRGIQAASPDTKIICCGLPSIIPGYSGIDKLTVSAVSDGNDWVQLVCRDTGCYYLDVSEALCESAQLLARFAGANGKTLNRQGLQEFLVYARTHTIQ